MTERPYTEEYLDAIALAAVVQALKRWLGGSGKRKEGGE